MNLGVKVDLFVLADHIIKLICSVGSLSEHVYLDRKAMIVKYRFVQLP